MQAEAALAVQIQQILTGCCSGLQPRQYSPHQTINIVAAQVGSASNVTQRPHNHHPSSKINVIIVAKDAT